MTRFFVCLLLALVLAGRVCAQTKEAGLLFFEQKIRPVLAENCYKCHSLAAKKERGGLRLDTRQGLLDGGDTGPAIVPGKPKASLLIKAIRHDGKLKMPPMAKLADTVVADFEKWIAMGAPDPRDGAGTVAKGGIDIEAGRKLWCYQPPKMPAVPDVKDKAWPLGDIDRFLLARREKEGLGAFPQADRATLMRRASYALIGLPPTPAEIDAFVADKADDLEAFAKVVDRLLASPHFGERWGRHWLDLARYAESSGGGRSLLFKDAWRYRDYVIQAFNDDMPFTQFILEQIAGDLLKAKTPEERRRLLIATAFLLLGPHNYERQDKPTLEMDIIDEQIDTLGKAFLGQTIGCARCHDHKFDPIPTRDYYALAGIFKSTKFIVHDNVSRWNEVNLPAAPKLEKEIAKAEADIAALQVRLAALKAEAKKMGKLGDDLVLVKGPIDPKTLPGIVVDDKQAKVVGSWKHSTYSGNYIGAGYLYDDRGFKDQKTVTFQPEFKKSGFYEVRLAYVPHTNRADNVAVRIFHADGDKIVRVNQQKIPPIDGRFISLGRYRFEEGDQWFVMVLTEKANGHVVADAVQFLPDEAIKKAPSPAKAEAPKGDILAEIKSLEEELKRKQTFAPKRPTAMGVSDADKIDDFYVCIRGLVANKGETAPRGFLQVALRGPAPKLSKKESGRRELAEWMASPDNPLTARVAVNRIWHHLFGAGIVRTVDIFGATGETPSHPELLDYLALRFIANGWSFKKTIREMMLTRSYMMASDARHAPHADKAPAWLETARKIDPENRLLWKMNRQRLEAEAIRDTMLAVAGTLDPALHGPGMKAGTTAERDYQFTDTRRSVYTPIFRNRLLELFEVFDFADPNTCNGRRTSSTVSTQALFLLNSPFVMEQARHAAERLLAEKGLSDKERLAKAYRDALGRPPSAAEEKLALAYLARASADARAAAWERVYQVIFACIDFRYVE
ncbi:MAG: DUF1553 domain-containing protein [Gemmataceae bacterium]